MITKPFEIPNYSVATISIDECSTEMETIINSGLINSGDTDLLWLNDNTYKIVHNYENGYAAYQILLWQMKNIVSKEAYFSSVFFHNDDALKELVNNYSAKILYSARNNAVKNDAFLTLCDLFRKVSAEIQAKKFNIETYKTLANIFGDIIRFRLSNLRKINNSDLEYYKKVLGVSYNECILIYENNTFRKEGLATLYWQLYNQVCDEIKNRKEVPDMTSRKPKMT